MTSDIKSAIRKLQQAQAMAETSETAAAIIVAQVAKDLIDALLEGNTQGPDPDNDPVDTRKSGGS